MHRVQPASTSDYEDLYKAVETVGPRVYRIIPENDRDTFTITLMGCQGNGKASQHAVAGLMNKKGRKPDLILGLGDNLYNDGASTPDDPQFAEYVYKVYNPAAVCATPTLGSSPSFNELVNLSKSSSSGEATAFVENLAHAIIFPVVGNHDANLHKFAQIKSYVQNVLTGRVISINEVAHTYITKLAPVVQDPLDDSSDSTDSIMQSFVASTSLNVESEDLIKQFSQPELKLKDLKLWNMPYFFYSLILGDTQIFCLDSNTYVSEFIQFHNLRSQFRTDESKRKNQAAWLEHEYRKAVQAGRKVILAQHHPLFTSGKRADPAHFDTKDYLTSAELITIKTILKFNSGSYNEILRKLFEFQGIKFDIVAVAHDHCLQYYNEKTPDAPNGLVQITSGGAGGDLQKRTHLLGYESVGCYFKTNGFVSLTFARSQPKVFEIEYFTTEGHHLRFTDQSHYPICQPITDKKLDVLRMAILSSVDEYFSLLLSALLYRKNNTSTSGMGNFFNRFSSTISSMASYLTSYEGVKREDIDIIHSITASLNQTVVPDFDSTVNKLIVLFEKLSRKPLEDERHPFYLFKHELNKFQTLSGKEKQDRHIQYTAKLTKAFAALRIDNPELIARKLVEFTNYLHNDDHPFLALVDSRIKEKFSNLGLFDLHPANIRHLKF